MTSSEETDQQMDTINRDPGPVTSQCDYFYII